MSFFKRIVAVAIDGPAGSGKSTVSKLVAGHLGYVYVDTGAMYRALTLKVMKKNIDLEDEGAITKLSSDFDLKLLPAGEGESTIRVILDGEDVSDDIRKMEVTTNVKHVCKIPAVREKLVALQRRMVAKMNGAVMEGRDIGTVVLPDADLKIFLTDQPEIRAERRARELGISGDKAAVLKLAQDISERDKRDAERKLAPMRPAKDAIEIDTSSMNFEDQVREVIKLACTTFSLKLYG